MCMQVWFDDDRAEPCRLGQCCGTSCAGSNVGRFHCHIEAYKGTIKGFGGNGMMGLRSRIDGNSKRAAHLFPERRNMRMMASIN